MEKENKKYRIWWIINPPNEPIFTNVNSVEEGYRLINEEAQRQLKQDWIISNVFGFDEFDGKEWCEWEDEDGNDIDRHFEKIEQANEMQGIHT